MRDMNENTNANNTMSKRFFLKGATAVWGALNVKAINVKNGNTETTTAIPEDKTLAVTFVDGFDFRAPFNNVSAEESALAYRKANHGRDFLLVDCNGNFVGWATFHRKTHKYDVAVTTTLSAVLHITAKSLEEAERLASEELENLVANSEIPYATVDDTCADAFLCE
jgi:hypothetical protein